MRKTERKMRVPVKAQRERLTNNQERRCREDIWLQILICRSHQTRAVLKERERERGSRGAFEISWHRKTQRKTASDKKNREDRKKIYDTTKEAGFLPCVHLLDQTHHSTAKHTNSRATATRLPGLSGAKQLGGKWHWPLAWKPRDCGSVWVWFSFNSCH